MDAKTDETGEYLYDINEQYKVRADLEQPLRDMNARRGWLGHFNQFPIIAGVNDRVHAVHTQRPPQTVTLLHCFASELIINACLLCLHYMLTLLCQEQLAVQDHQRITSVQGSDDCMVIILPNLAQSVC